jgi:hypothetical protein
MAHAFQPLPGNVAFRKLKESNYASDYIYNKKSLIAYCVEKKDFQCKKSWNQGELFLYNNGRYIVNNMPCSSFNTTNLGSNLYTKENLTGVCVIQDTSGGFNCNPFINAIPTLTAQNSPLYFRYVIDPAGNLFGRTDCGVNNYANYMVPSLQGSNNLYSSYN